MIQALQEIYQSFILSHGFDADAQQLRLIQLLSPYKISLEARRNGSRLKNLFSFATKPAMDYQGVYVYGEVGRGKSMMINLFFDSLMIAKKQRLHFHEFMLNFHAILHDYQQRYENTNGKVDHVVSLAKETSNKVEVLYLDELQVNNIADAMILGRLFTTLLDNGTFVLFTSNRPPCDLFKDGLQRERFMPFIKLIETKLMVFRLDNAKDYRLGKSSSLKRSYIYPLDSSTAMEVKNMMGNLIGSRHLTTLDLVVDKNRILKLKRVCDDIAFFTFDELCAVPLGTIDYIKITETFNTLVIEKIPILEESNYNEALRFITLIDCLYEAHINLVCTAHVAIDEIYAGGKNQFEFQRTISRLKEMQSREYIIKSEDLLKSSA